MFVKDCTSSNFEKLEFKCGDNAQISDQSQHIQNQNIDQSIHYNYYIHPQYLHVHQSQNQIYNPLSTALSHIQPIHLSHLHHLPSNNSLIPTLTSTSHNSNSNHLIPRRKRKHDRENDAIEFDSVDPPKKRQKIQQNENDDLSHDHEKEVLRLKYENDFFRQENDRLKSIIENYKSELSTLQTEGMDATKKFVQEKNDILKEFEELKVVYNAIKEETEMIKKQLSDTRILLYKEIKSNISFESDIKSLNVEIQLLQSAAVNNNMNDSLDPNKNINIKDKTSMAIDNNGFNASNSTMNNSVLMNASNNNTYNNSNNNYGQVTNVFNYYSASGYNGHQYIDQLMPSVQVNQRAGPLRVELEHKRSENLENNIRQMDRIDDLNQKNELPKDELHVV